MAVIKCPECGKEVRNKAYACPECGYQFGQQSTKNPIMGRWIVLTIAVGIICLISGISMGKAMTKSKKVAVEQQTNKTADIKSIDEEDSETMQKPTEEIMIAVGDVADITNEYGKYEVTVEHVRTCDWLTRANQEIEGMTAVLIECDVNNISYEDPDNSIFWLNNMMSVTDNNGYVLEMLSFSYDDGEYNGTAEIPKGARSKLVIAYKVNSRETTLHINFNNQYIMPAQIEL